RNVFWVLPGGHVDQAPCVWTANVKDVHPFDLRKLQELHTIRRYELTWPAGGFTSRVRLESIVEPVIQEGSRPWLERNLAVFWIGISQCVGTRAGSTPRSEVGNSQTRIDRKPQAGFARYRSEIHTAVRKMRRRTRRRYRAATAAAASRLTLSEGKQMKQQEKSHHSQDSLIHYESSAPICVPRIARQNK